MNYYKVREDVGSVGVKKGEIYSSKELKVYLNTSNFRKFQESTFFKMSFEKVLKGDNADGYSKYGRHVPLRYSEKEHQELVESKILNELFKKHKVTKACIILNFERTKPATINLLDTTQNKKRKWKRKQ